MFSKEVGIGTIAHEAPFPNKSNARTIYSLPCRGNQD